MKVCELFNVFDKEKYTVNLYGRNECLLYKGFVKPLCYDLYGEREIKRLEFDECEVSFDIYMFSIDS